MASTKRVVIVDDLDGSTQGVEGVWIGLDGDLYEVDLSAQHRQQLMAVLGPFIAHARPVPEVEDAPRPPRSREWPYVPPPYGHLSQTVLKARAAPTPVGYEHPDYPWFPFKGTGKKQAEQVRAWAAQQGIPMPHRGIPRSVLLAYRRSEKATEQTAGQSAENEGSSPTA